MDLAVALGIVSIIVGCGPTIGSPTVDVRVLPEIGRQPTFQASTPNYAHTPAAPIIRMCAALGWTTCAIPEYTDDQGLMGDRADSYGPHAFLSPAEDLGTLVDRVPFQVASGRLVGLVFIEAGTLPNSYRELHLVNGFNCLYLKYQSGWTARIAAPSGTVCEASAPSNAQPLDVRAAALPTGFTANDIPPVARFHEMRKGNGKGHAGFGLRCGNEWCMILPTATTPADTLPLPHKPDRPSDKTWAVHGWHDVQTLSLPPASTPGEPLRSRTEAAVIPTRELQALNAGTFPSDFRHVATVRFWGDPPGRYESVWKFRHGFNEIWMRRITDTQWEAEVRHWVTMSGAKALVTVRKLKVERFDHGRLTPSTARFLWSLADEDLWVSCEDGCCKVSPGFQN